MSSTLTKSLRLHSASTTLRRPLFHNRIHFAPSSFLQQYAITTTAAPLQPTSGRQNTVAMCYSTNNNGDKNNGRFKEKSSEETLKELGLDVAPKEEPPKKQQPESTPNKADSSTTTDSSSSQENKTKKFAEKARNIAGKAATTLSQQGEHLKGSITHAGSKIKDTSEELKTKMESINKEDINKKVDEIRSNRSAIPLAIIVLGVLAGVGEYYRKKNAKEAASNKRK